MRCRVVEFPEFELLHFLRMHVRPGAHNLAESNWFGTLVEVAHSHDFNEEHGLPELRETLAALHGVCVEQLLLTAGASEANFLLAAALLSVIAFHWLFAGTAIGFAASALLIASVMIPRAGAPACAGRVAA